MILGVALGSSGPARAAGTDVLTSVTNTQARLVAAQAATADKAGAAAAAKALGVQVPGAGERPVPEARIDGPGAQDLATQSQSVVYGANLFNGAFARQGATVFNPDYAVAVGDKIQVRLWGAFDFDAQLIVDPQGNVFLPHVGPVRVLGVRNADLQRLVEGAVARAFRSNVGSYASLAAAQPVRIFVGGNVLRPGLYSGTSMDSLLHFLDQAGGIDPDRGSFLAVQVKRGGNLRAEVNLYQFLLQGVMPPVQLSDGDVLFVPPRGRTVLVAGMAEQPKRFEFSTEQISVAELVALARPLASATHVRVARNTGTVRNIEYHALADARALRLADGDTIEFTADKKPGTITVRLEGEQTGPQEYVLPYGTRLGELLRRIEYTERSDRANLQLFRQSVKDRQRLLLQASLRSLETAALTARAGTNDEALLRREEAGLLLQWVDRAKKAEPTGQVVMGRNDDRDKLLLENGDVLRVPVLDGLVLVNGEVLFPNASAWSRDLKVEDYVRLAGGYTQNADVARIVVARRDGSYVQSVEEKGWFFGSSSRIDAEVQAGDEILVLPKIDVKSRQITKDLSQIIFQLALSAKAIFGL
jgi:protein involved in polysaccharide export with SLBB domain